MLKSLAAFHKATKLMNIDSNVADISKEMTLDGYFFANRDVHWLVLGISFLTTCLFTPYLLGLTSSGLTLIYGVISIAMLFILGWFLAPIFFKNKINTLPEYFEKRFNRNCKLYLSALYIQYFF